MKRFKNIMLKSIKTFLVSLLFGGMANAQNGEEVKKFPPMRVLFIGNSYTHMNSMPKLFEKMAKFKGIHIEVTMSAKSNHTFKMHSERKDLFRDIKKHKWDYVILQGFSRELMHDEKTIDSASIPYFQQILDSIYQNNPCTNVLLYMTWGYENGYKYREDVNTYIKMSDKIKEGYLYLSKRFNLPVVPVGDVYRMIRERDPSISLYREDHMHPTIYGSFTIASSFYAAIFDKNPYGSYMPKEVSKEKAKLIQNTVYEYIHNHREEFLLNRNVLHIDYQTSGKRRYVLRGKANYPEATNIIWDFGDGKTFKGHTAYHVYRKPKVYHVTITIIDNCGKRIIHRRVAFKEFVKPRRRQKLFSK